MRGACVRVVAIAALALAPAARPVCGAERELRVTPEIERAVTRGLGYLARTQKSDGSWPGDYGQGSGVVGMAMMAYLAHGEIPDEGRYGRVMRRAVEYIVRTQQPNGLLMGRSGSAMYNHGFATLALAEVYGQMDYPELGPALKKATGLIVTAQNALGGWRYSVGSQDADTTVSGAQMVGLRAAATAGMETPYSAIKRGVNYYKSCFCPGGGFGYTGPQGTNAIRAGIGSLVLSLSGAYRSKENKESADWLLANMGGNDGGHFYYMCYYASQAMCQAGGKYWRSWNETMTPMLLAMQQADGSWSARGSGGKTLATAFALLSIEINYNYLPIYQR